MIVEREVFQLVGAVGHGSRSEEIIRGHTEWLKFATNVGWPDEAVGLHRGISGVLGDVRHGEWLKT